MKKRLLFYFSFVTFMIFSFTRCSQDFLETSDESENFAREARLYFEQNASGIQNVSIGDQKTVLSRNMNLSSAVIVPRWEKQEYSVRVVNNVVLKARKEAKEYLKEQGVNF